MKTSIPKLHSIKWKNGVLAENVERLTGWSKSGIHPTDIIQEAFSADLESIVVIGKRKNGKEYVDWSYAKDEDVAYLLARMHLRMLRNGDENI